MKKIKPIIFVILLTLSAHSIGLFTALVICREIELYPMYRYVTFRPLEKFQIRAIDRDEDGNYFVEYSNNYGIYWSKIPEQSYTNAIVATSTDEAIKWVCKWKNNESLQEWIHIADSLNVTRQKPNLFNSTECCHQLTR